ncbi:hypothetical protein EJ06DRAFT_27269 [Trichodelitschia bisporula]|uniref:Uncharacterized protein n=1 Tax=Trichodelitschia bisporula TaxID=703511 RepID=A0A6G1IAY8_9PEZI|nr:hypothetical protein EJ06DRAFT_27269 [Trichodelitschia bisporula]
MFYIRFLKTPKLEGDRVTALITITTDLGEKFLSKDVILSADIERAHAPGIFASKDINWACTSRCLPISISIKWQSIQWPVRLHLRAKEPSNQEFHLLQTLPSIIPVWSNILDPTKGICQSERTLQRRFKVNQQTFVVWEEAGESIARHIWDAGVALTICLGQLMNEEFQRLALVNKISKILDSGDSKAIELGCGCGLVGISFALSFLNCSMTLTDLPEVTEILGRSITELDPSVSSRISFEPLNWDKALPESVLYNDFDLILVADCTYNSDSSPALVETISNLVKRSPGALTVVAMKVRHPSEAVFFELMSKAGLAIASHVEIPLASDVSDNEVPESIDVYCFSAPDQ